MCNGLTAHGTAGKLSVPPTCTVKGIPCLPVAVGTVYSCPKDCTDCVVAILSISPVISRAFHCEVSTVSGLTTDCSSFSDCSLGPSPHRVITVLYMNRYIQCRIALYIRKNERNNVFINNKIRNNSIRPRSLTWAMVVIVHVRTDKFSVQSVCITNVK